MARRRLRSVHHRAPFHHRESRPKPLYYLWKSGVRVRSGEFTGRIIGLDLLFGADLLCRRRVYPGPRAPPRPAHSSEQTRGRNNQTAKPGHDHLNRAPQVGAATAATISSIIISDFSLLASPAPPPSAMRWAT